MDRSERPPGRRWRWFAWILFVEVLILLVSVRAYLPSSRDRRAGREGNTIARLVFDDPGMLESFAFYIAMTHIAMGLLFLLAHLSARRKRRLMGERATAEAID